MATTFIRNRRRQKLAVLVDRAEGSAGLAFVMHGLGGFKEQPHLEAIAKVFLDRGYTVVRFDATNTLGESDGSYQYATVTNYLQDLEDVIAWAKTQPWYQAPFVLAAHNMGGICISWYAAAHPDEVKALAPVATIISGELSLEALRTKESAAMDVWQSTGWLVRESRSRPGMMKRLKWTHMEDRMKYDLLSHAHLLKMPVFLAVGGGDYITPVAHQQMLYDRLGGQKELHVIPLCGHRFREVVHLRTLERALGEWVDAKVA